MGKIPVDAADFEKLRDSLYKLRLNDASFSFEMETSAALAAVASSVNAYTCDGANAFFNDWSAAGCDCSQPTHTETGDWFVECTCSSEPE